jgi:hypothetical protein
MAKRKRDPVVPEMRQRLLVNRDGRMTSGQWLDLVAQPLTTLALLLGASYLVFGSYMVTFAADFWWVGVPLIVLLVFVPVAVRAYRYARAPVHFARLFAGVQPLLGFGAWKSQVFYTDANQPVTFRRRLAPRMPLSQDAEYIVYYLEDSQGRVLLSAAPADHQDADHWLPTPMFEARYERRAGRI